MNLVIFCDGAIRYVLGEQLKLLNWVIFHVCV